MKERPPRRKSRRAYIRFRLWARRHALGRKLSFLVALAALVSGIVTVFAWTGSEEFGPDPRTIQYLLYVDAVLVLLLGVIIVRQTVRLWAERRRGLAGSGLHVRIVIMFSALAVTPAILVAIFSALFLNFGIQAWFSERVRTAVEASNAVAKAYLDEHRQSIRAEVFAMANDLNREAPTLMRSPRVFDEFITNEARVRSLPEAVVVDSAGRVIARAPFSLTLDLELIPWEALQQAALGQIVTLSSDNDDRVRAVVKLNQFVDAYLVVGRFVDPQVLRNIAITDQAVAQYKQLEESRGGILITFVMIFVVVALLLLLTAVWVGMNLATEISRPISALVAAAERIRTGDLSVRVKATGSSVGEIGTLSRAFNRMTSQLKSQQDGLLLVNRDLDERRRFTEAVLSGVSAGVIGLDARLLIHLPNRSASELLGLELESLVGTPLTDVVPEMAGLLAQAVERPERQWQSEVRLIRDGRTHTFMTRIVAEKSGGAVVGYVVTFDDISPLVAAERKAAWADVARRIAHEIKNPLTPIQLASERLKRKYLREITSDPQTFAACTETIIRQVEDIGRMVDEFSTFARMPRPELKTENLNEIVAETVFLERNRYANIGIAADLPSDILWMVCDSRQVAQALVNLLKNAAEAIVGRIVSEGAELPPGRIVVTLRLITADAGPRIVISVEDNGRGLPTENRERLTEPYVTTRTRGTGLGLAIVKKILEDHGGDLLLEDREGGGARVTMIFAVIAERSSVDGHAAVVHVPDISASARPMEARRAHA